MFFQSLGRPVAYYPIFASKLGGVTPAVMFSQLAYWYRIDAVDQWIYKTATEMYNETGLTRREQDTARDKLVSLGVLETKLAGVPAKTHYRIVWEAFEKLWVTEAPIQFGGKRQTSLAESANLSIQRIQQETTTQPPVATLPATRKTKNTPEDIALHTELKTLMAAKGDHWKNGVAEAKTLYDIIKWCHVQSPEGWADFAHTLVAMFWKLKNGHAPGQSYKDRDFWSKQPFTPCGLSPLCTRVSQYLRVDVEAAGQLEGFGK
jgi:hypothetical protein